MGRGDRLAAEFTANWSYTALSRAREPTEIYVIADEDRFAAERAEIAPPDQHARTPLQRMAMSMRRRDDEDLALDWIEPPELPSVGAGSASTRVRAGAVAEATMDPGRASVGELRRELAALESRLASYPEREVRELEAARARRADAERTVADTRERIGALEAKRRPDAPALAYERARLDRAERALEHETRAEARLSAEVPERSQVQPEAADLRTRRDALRDELGKRREAQVRAALESPGSYLERALGKRPQDRPARDAWVRAATAIERYRFDHDVRGPSPLGNRPIEREAQLAHRRAQREIERANRRLGRELARTHGREL